MKKLFALLAGIFAPLCLIVLPLQAQAAKPVKVFGHVTFTTLQRMHRLSAVHL